MEQPEEKNLNKTTLSHSRQARHRKRRNKHVWEVEVVDHAARRFSLSGTRPVPPSSFYIKARPCEAGKWRLPSVE